MTCSDITRSFGVIRPTCLKMAYNSKTVGFTVMWSEVCYLGHTCVPLSDHVVVPHHFGGIHCACVKVACNSKTVFRMVKQAEIGNEDLNNMYACIGYL